MRREIKDPGFAFSNSSIYIPEQGLTKRDYFAAAALTGLCSIEHWPGSREERVAEAYHFADAMLEAREE